jgi:methionine biosynthesis protein MetW
LPRSGLPPDRRRELELIADMVPAGARVLDLGCGDGGLLSFLAEHREAAGFGVDIDLENVIEVIDRGHDVFQADIDAGLAAIPDGAYDCAVLSETLQVVQQPRFVLQEMLRVAAVGIVSFPNFGKWSHRVGLMVRGRMPKGRSLPFEWYDTPNIHLFTRHDFIDLCRADGIDVLDMVCIPDGWLSRALVRMRRCNLGADRVIAKISRATDAAASVACRPGALRAGGPGGG